MLAWVEGTPPSLEISSIFLEKSTALSTILSTMEAAATHRIDSTLPDYARAALEVLEHDGWSAWLVGGCVRDALLGLPAHDIDIATNAHWECVRDAFARAGSVVHETGTAHGTVTVVFDGHPIEITTYRVESSYSDARHPDAVTFVDDIELDLGRRDFTMNAIAYHPSKGLCNPYFGLEDVRTGVIRTVRSPHDRFEEDPLRILRGLRFASQLGFRIEPKTAQAMRQLSDLLEGVAHERVGSELTKLLLGKGVRAVILDYEDILSTIVPELAGFANCPLNPHRHEFDLLEHTARTVEALPCDATLRYAGFLHDMGKPFCVKQGIPLCEHPAESTRRARVTMQRLRLKRNSIDAVCRLIALHGAHPKPCMPAVLLTAALLGESLEEAERLFILQRADAIAHGEPGASKLASAERLLALCRQARSENLPTGIASLGVRGSDIVSLGIEPGPQVRSWLEFAFLAVIENKVSNEKQPLMSFLAQTIHEQGIHPCFEERENLFQKKFEKLLDESPRCP